MYHPTPFWLPAKFLLRNLLTVLCKLPCMWLTTFLLLLSRFFVFDFRELNCNLVSQCDSLDLTLLEFFKFLKSACTFLISDLESFLSFFQMSSLPSGISMICILVYLIVWYKSLSLSSGLVLYSFFFSDLISNDPSSTLLSFFFLSSLLNPFSQGFNLVTVFFQLHIFFIVFISLLIFSFCSSFSWFHLVIYLCSLSSLSVLWQLFKIFCYIVHTAAFL